MPPEIKPKPKSFQEWATRDSGFTSSSEPITYKQETTYTPTEVEVFKEYGVDTKPQAGDPFEQLGQNQSNIEKIWHGTERLVGTTLTKFAGGIGYIGGFGDYAINGFDDISRMTDNVWSAKFSDYEENLKDFAPIYTPTSVSEGGLWGKMSSTSWWMDQGVDGAAFMFSSIIPGAIIGKVGLGMKLASAGAKAVELGAGLEKGIKTANYLSKVNLAKNIDLTAATIYNTVIEAGIEAKGVQDNIRNSYEQELLDGTITVEEVEERAAKAASDTFKLNSIVLAVPNFIEQKMFFGQLGKSGDVMKRLFNAETGALIEGAEKFTKRELVANMGKAVGLGILREGFWEENVQLAIQNYEQIKGRGEDYKDGTINADSLENIAKGMYDNLFTDEGQESIFLGAVMGLAGGAVGAVREKKQERLIINNAKEYLKNNIDTYNTNLKADIQDVFVKDKDGNIQKDPQTGKPIIDEIKAGELMAKVIAKSQDEQIKNMAAITGVKDLYDFIKHKQFVEYVLPFLSYEGGLDVVNAQIDNMSEEQLKDQKEVNEGFGEAFNIQEVKQKLKEKAKETYENYQNINNRTGAWNFAENKEESKIFTSFLQNYQSELAQRTSTMEFLRGKADEAVKELNLLNVKLQNRIYYNTDSEKTLEQIVTPEEREERDRLEKKAEQYTKQLKQKIKDYGEVNTKKALKERWEKLKGKAAEQDEIINKSATEASQASTQEQDKARAEQAEKAGKAKDPSKNLVDNQLKEEIAAEQEAERLVIEENRKKQIEAERSPQEKRIRDVINKTKKRQKRTESKIVQTESTLEYLENLLEETLSAIKDNNLIPLENALKSLDKIKSTKSSLKTLRGKALQDKKEELKKNIKSAFDIAQDIQNRIRELQDELNILEETKKDLKRRADYYSNLIQNKSLETLSVEDLKNEKSRIEKKLTSTNILINKLRNVIRKGLDYLRDITKYITSYFKKVEDIKNKTGLTFENQSEEVKNLLEKEKRGEISLEEQTLLENYSILREDFEKANEELENALTHGEINEDQYKSSLLELQRLVDKAVSYQNNIRYIQDLINTIGAVEEKNKRTPITPKVEVESNIIENTQPTVLQEEVIKQEEAIAEEVIASDKKDQTEGDMAVTEEESEESGTFEDMVNRAARTSQSIPEDTANKNSEESGEEAYNPRPEEYEEKLNTSEEKLEEDEDKVEEPDPASHVFSLAYKLMESSQTKSGRYKRTGEVNPEADERLFDPEFLKEGEELILYIDTQHPDYEKYKDDLNNMPIAVIKKSDYLAGNKNPFSYIHRTEWYSNNPNIEENQTKALAEETKDFRNKIFQNRGRGGEVIPYSVLVVDKSLGRLNTTKDQHSVFSLSDNPQIVVAKYDAVIGTDYEGAIVGKLVDGVPYVLVKAPNGKMFAKYLKTYKIGNTNIGNEIADTIHTLLHEHFSKQGNSTILRDAGIRDFKDIEREIKKFVYFGNRTANSIDIRKTFYATEEGVVTIGGKSFDLTKEHDIEAVKAAIKDLYISVNTLHIQDKVNAKFSYLTFNGEKLIRNYKPYKKFLDESGFITMNAKANFGTIFGNYVTKIDSASLKPFEESIVDETPVITPEVTPTTDTKADAEYYESSYGTIAADYLFTGGKGVILSTDYLLQALTAVFPYSGKAIDNIRNKYANELSQILKDDINTDTYNSVMQEIRDEINNTYGNKKANEIFEKILKNATGFTLSREGNQVSSDAEKLNGELKTKINAKVTQPTTDAKADIEKELNRPYAQLTTEAEKKKEYNRISGDFPKIRELISKAIDVIKRLDTVKDKEISDKIIAKYYALKSEMAKLTAIDENFMDKLQEEIYSDGQYNYKIVEDKYLDKYSEANRHENKIAAKYKELAALEAPIVAESVEKPYIDSTKKHSFKRANKQNIVTDKTAEDKKDNCK